MKKIVLTVALIAVFCGAANAVIFGIRYSNVTRPVVAPFETDEGRGRFGIYFGEREKSSDFLLGIDYDSYKREGGDTLSYSRRVVVDFGYRYRVFSGDRSAAMKILPFAAIHYYKGFGKVEADTSVLSNSDRKYYKDLMSDHGGWISVGAEYAFAPAFSMGCEAGLLYTNAKSKAYGYTIKISDYRTFVAILMSFRF